MCLVSLKIRLNGNNITVQESNRFYNELSLFKATFIIWIFALVPSASNYFAVFLFIIKVKTQDKYILNNCNITANIENSKKSYNNILNI